MPEDLAPRVSKLEEEVTGLKVDSAKIATTLEHVVKGMDEIKDSLNSLCPDKTASAPSKWVKDVLTPQTITIILAILASALGAPMLAQQVLNAPTNPAIERIETQPSPSTQP
jgi:hypothetical protein